MDWISAIFGAAVFVSLLSMCAGLAVLLGLDETEKRK